MSFILDALKKSENDRQRQSGPALYEVKVAAPRSPLPLWAIGLIVLLGINLVIVAWVLLRRPSQPSDTQTAAVTASAPQPATPASAMPPPAQSAPGIAAGPPPAPAGGLQGTVGSPTAYAEQAPPVAARTLPDSASAQTGPRAVQEGSGEAPSNPDDYAPATEPAPSQSPGLRVKRGTEAGVPLYSQIANGPGSGLPDLRLDMHAWDEKPENRFVLINMKTLHEGDTLPNGVKVEAITREGAVLSHNGTKFLLPHP
jgi:general secretion pathway protein B